MYIFDIILICINLQIISQMVRLLFICLIGTIFLINAATACASDNRDIEKTILTTINKGKIEKVKVDKKLSELADYLNSSKSSPNVATANRYGIYDMQFETAGVQASDTSFFEQAELFAGINKSNVVGVSIKLEDGIYSVVVVGVKRYVEIPRINPKITSNTTEIKGKWTDPNSTPNNITVTAPDGSGVSYDIEGLVKNNEFKVMINTPSQGKYTCEINAKSNQGPLSGATIFLFKNIEPDYTYTVGDTSNNTIGYWLELINTERAKQNLKPLVLSQKLSKIAQSHSVDMAVNDYVAHVSPTTGSIQDRIKGIEYTALGENIALGGSVAEIHNGLMGSPAHRKNIMGDYTTVGLGLYKKGNSYYATQVFIK